MQQGDGIAASKLSAGLRSRLQRESVRHEAERALDATAKLLRNLTVPRAARPAAGSSDLGTDPRAMAAVHRSLEDHNRIQISGIKLVETEELPPGTAGEVGMLPPQAAVSSAPWLCCAQVTQLCWCAQVSWQLRVDWSHRQREVIQPSR